MNEYTIRKLIVQAVNGSGKIGTERQFWATVLTALKGSFSAANNESEFWRKFADHLGDKLAPLPPTETVVATGDSITIGETTYTFTVSGNTITNVTASP